MTVPAVAGVSPTSASPAVGRRPLAARIAIGLIRTYQAARFGHVSPCRFTPTCSEYAAQALDRHGLRRGLGLTLRRLGRCRPFGPYGADPVPSLQVEPVAPLDECTISAPAGRTPTAAPCGADTHPTPAGRPRPGMRS